MFETSDWCLQLHAAAQILNAVNVDMCCSQKAGLRQYVINDTVNTMVIKYHTSSPAVARIAKPTVLVVSDLQLKVIQGR